MCDVFAYPTAPHIRRHRPAGYVDYRSFKPWLRDDFTFRCVYCLSRERWYPSGQNGFSVEHTVSQRQAPERVCDYENLLYACVRCNSCKQDALLPDPCAVGYAQLLRIRDDGIAEGLTLEAQRLIDTLLLNDDIAVDFRCRLLRALRRLVAGPGRSAAILSDWLGFPIDLPDLSELRPPDGNRRPEGMSQSWFALRRSGALPTTY